MKDPWKRFKEIFRRTRNLDDLRGVELEITGSEDEILELQESLSKLGLLGKDPDQDKELLAQVIESVKEDLNLAQTRLTVLKGELHDKTVQEHIFAMEAKDQEELEGLTDPDTGDIAKIKEEISRLSISASVSKALVATHAADVEDAELALQGHLVLHFPELKELLTAMLEAQESLETVNSELLEASPQLAEHQDAFDEARRQMERLSSDRSELPWADTIVDNFRLQTGLLASMQESIRLLRKRQAEAKGLLAKQTELFERALEEAVKAVPTEPEAKEAHDKLVELEAALREAKEELARAKEEQDREENKVEVKELELSHLEDRSALLRERAGVLRLGAELSTLLNGVSELKGVKIWEESVSVLAEKMGEDKFKAFQEKGLAFTNGLAKLTGLGMSSEEVQLLYEELLWPENWHPPFMRAEEANWLKVTDNMDKVSIEQEEKGGRIDTLGFPELGRTEALKRFGTGLKKLGLVGDDEAAQVNGWLTLVTSIMSLGKAGQKAIGASKALRDEESSDPVEHMMLVDDCLSALGKSCGALLGTAKDAFSLSTAEAVAAMVPGLGALVNFGNACAGAISATNYWMAATADAEVHRRAKDKLHRIEASADHVSSQGKHVAARAASQTAVELIAFCGHICTLSGIAAPVGQAFSLGTMALGKVKDVVTWAVDATRMERARKLLSRAKAGDSGARSEVFRHHGKYSTALIALLAQEGDPMALAIYKNHRITPEMVVRSSAKVLQKYLLRQLQEETSPPSWTEMAEWFRSQGERLVQAFKGAFENLKALAKKVAVIIKPKPTEDELAEANLAMRRMGMVSVTRLQTAVSNYTQLRESLGKREEEYAGMSSEDDGYPRATKLITKWRKQVAKHRERVERIFSAVYEAMDGALKDVFALGDSISEAGLERFQQLVGVQRRCLSALAQVM